MEVEVGKDEINIQRLLKAAEKLASEFANDLAREASSLQKANDTRYSTTRSSYQVNIFKKYVEDISTRLDQLTLDREEYDKYIANQNSNLIAAAGRIEDDNKKIPRVPVKRESLEEYRRKLSFLANLLNAPRWYIPQHEAAINRVTRNLRLDHDEQMSELNTASRVRLNLQDEMRKELTLAPLYATEDSSLLSSNKTNENSLTSSDAGYSPSSYETKNQMNSISSKALKIFYFDDTEADQETEDQSVGSGDHGISTEPVARVLWSPTVSSSNRVRLPLHQDSELGDLDRMLTSNEQIAEDLTEELVKYAAAMKVSAINTGLKLQSDAEDLNKMEQKMESNTKMAESATGTVNELLNTSSYSIWGTWTTAMMVILIFAGMYLFIKFIPKP